MTAWAEPQGPLPRAWASVDDINRIRQQWALAPLPSSRTLTASLLEYGFTDCEGTMYQRPDPVVATSEAEVLVA